MAGASTFPRVIDTDDVLYRVDSDSLLIPSMHNNHVDALQTLEIVVGVSDDGSGSGITPALNSSLSDVLHWPGPASPNTHRPFASQDARSIYGNDNSTLAQWTLGAGIAASWVNPVGMLRLTLPASANTLIASVDLPAESLMWFMMNLFVDVLTEPGIAAGFSIAGTGADMDGVGFPSQTGGTPLGRKVENGTRATSGTNLVMTPPQGCIAGRWNGSTHDLYHSYSGVFPPTPVYTWSSRGTPTKFCLYTTHAPSFATYLWIRYLIFGWANPATYLA